MHGDSALLTVQKDESGTLWAGTYEDGLFSIRSNIVERVPFEQTGQRRITALYRGRGGILWIGTDSGLASYDGRQFVRFGTNAGLPTRRVLSLAEDASGDLWVGTTQGLFRRRNRSFAAVRLPHAETDTRILALSRIADTLWIGTIGAWRACGTGNSCPLSKRQGLPASGVGCILEDKAENLWLATPRHGVVRVTRASLSKLSPRGEALGWRRYALASGGATVHFRSEAGRSGVQDLAVKALFGSMKSLLNTRPVYRPTDRCIRGSQIQVLTW